MRVRFIILIAGCVMALMPVPASASGIESTPLGLPTATAAAPAKAKASPSTLGSAAMRTGTSLAAVLVVIGGVALGFKHLAKKGVLPATLGTAAPAPSGLLEVLARFPMGGGQSLVVLKFDRRVLLVCQTAGKGWRRAGGAMTLVSELTEPEDVASVLLKVRGREQAAMAEKFQKLLAGEDAAAERALAAPAVRVPSPRTHDKAPRPARVMTNDTGAASASAIRSRLSAMREQDGGSTGQRAVVAKARAGRAEFVG